MKWTSPAKVCLTTQNTMKFKMFMIWQVILSFFFDKESECNTDLRIIVKHFGQRPNLLFNLSKKITLVANTIYFY